MEKTPTPTESVAVLTSLMVQLPAKVGYKKNYVNRIAGIDLYKYDSKQTFPLISSFCSYCKVMGIEPGFFFMIVGLVQNRELTEENALDILAAPDKYQTIMVRYERVLLNSLSNPNNINQPEPTE